MLDTIIRNFKLLEDGAWVFRELGIVDGTIAALSDSVTDRAREEMDAGGAYALPGAVDLHVHFNEPGRTEWEGFQTGSAAAAAGGISTLADMPLNNVPSTVSVEAMQTKLEAIRGKSYVDYALWGGVVPGNADALEPMAEAGVMGFKAFMSPSGTNDFENSDVSTLREAMRRIARTGLRLALHAEDPAVLAESASKLGRRETALDWEVSRPIESEVSAVKIAIELSIETGCPITIVHVSAPEVLDVIDAAKVQGVDILAETCPHYLLLNIEKAGLIGVSAKCAPPLRSEATLLALCEAVLNGRIDTIGSDHSPSSPDLKAGLSFYKAWGGIAGIQHGLPLLMDRFGIEDSSVAMRLQQLIAVKPAQVCGLKGKGALEVGADADIAFYRSLQSPEMIQSDVLCYRHKMSPYVGLTSQVEVASTWLRGRCIYKDGKIRVEPSGRFIHCAPN